MTRLYEAVIEGITGPGRIPEQQKNLNRYVNLNCFTNPKNKPGAGKTKAGNIASECSFFFTSTLAGYDGSPIATGNVAIPNLSEMRIFWSNVASCLLANTLQECNPVTGEVISARLKPNVHFRCATVLNESVPGFCRPLNRRAFLDCDGLIVVSGFERDRIDNVVLPAWMNNQIFELFAGHFAQLFECFARRWMTPAGQGFDQQRCFLVRRDFEIKKGSGSLGFVTAKAGFHLIFPHLFLSAEQKPFFWGEAYNFLLDTLEEVDDPTNPHGPRVYRIGAITDPDADAAADEKQQRQYDVLLMTPIDKFLDSGCLKNHTLRPIGSVAVNEDKALTRAFNAFMERGAAQTSATQMLNPLSSVCPCRQDKTPCTHFLLTRGKTPSQRETVVVSVKPAYSLVSEFKRLSSSQDGSGGGGGGDDDDDSRFVVEMRTKDYICMNQAELARTLELCSVLVYSNEPTLGPMHGEELERIRLRVVEENNGVMVPFDPNSNNNNNALGASDPSLSDAKFADKLLIHLLENDDEHGGSDCMRILYGWIGNVIMRECELTVGLDTMTQDDKPVRIVNLRVESGGPRTAVLKTINAIWQRNYACPNKGFGVHGKSFALLVFKLSKKSSWLNIKCGCNCTGPQEESKRLIDSCGALNKRGIQKDITKYASSLMLDSGEFTLKITEPIQKAVRERDRQRRTGIAGEFGEMRAAADADAFTPPATAMDITDDF